MDIGNAPITYPLSTDLLDGIRIAQDTLIAHQSIG